MEANKKTLGLYRSGMLIITTTMLGAVFTSCAAHPRSMLSAHLLGLTGGLLMIAIGTMLPYIHLGKFESIMLFCVHVGNWCNVAHATYSAVTGAIPSLIVFSRDGATNQTTSQFHVQVATFLLLITTGLIGIGMVLATLGIMCPCGKSTCSMSSAGSERKSRPMEKAIRELKAVKDRSMSPLKGSGLPGLSPSPKASKTGSPARSRSRAKASTKKQ